MNSPEPEITRHPPLIMTIEPLTGSGWCSDRASAWSRRHALHRIGVLSGIDRAALAAYSIADENYLIQTVPGLMNVIQYLDACRTIV